MAYITDGMKQYNALNERYGCKDNNVRRFFYNAHLLEESGRNAALSICNDANFNAEAARKRLRGRLEAFLEKNFKNIEKAKKEFVLNWDPRGYFVKIEAEDIPHTDIFMDYGRSGILVPLDIEIGGVVHRNSNNIVNDKFVW